MKLENVAVVSKVGNKDSEKAANDVAKKLLATKATVYTISPVIVEGTKQMETLEEIQKVKFGLQSNLSSDLMAIDIKQALYYFGEITGEVTNDELLGNIFANFCIGK